MPSFKRILGFEFGIKDRCYERIVENNFTDPYTSKAESTMQKVSSKTYSNQNIPKQKNKGFFVLMTI